MLRKVRRKRERAKIEETAGTQFILDSFEEFETLLSRIEDSSDKEALEFKTKYENKVIKLKNVVLEHKLNLDGLKLDGSDVNAILFSGTHFKLLEEFQGFSFDFNIDASKLVNVVLTPEENKNA